MADSRLQARSLTGGPLGSARGSSAGRSGILDLGLILNILFTRVLVGPIAN